MANKVLYIEDNPTPADAFDQLLREHGVVVYWLNPDNYGNDHDKVAAEVVQLLEGWREEGLSFVVMLDASWSRDNTEAVRTGGIRAADSFQLIKKLQSGWQHGNVPTVSVTGGLVPMVFDFPPNHRFTPVGSHSKASPVKAVEAVLSLLEA